MRTSPHKQLRRPAQRHTASKWQSSGSSPGPPIRPTLLASGAPLTVRETNSPSKPFLQTRPRATSSLGKDREWVPPRPWRLTHLSQAGVVTRQRALQALSSQLLVAIPDSMRKQEVRRGGEAGQGRGPGSPAGQVKVLVDLLAGKSSQSSQTPQTLDRTPHGDGRHMEGLPGPSPSTPPSPPPSSPALPFGLCPTDSRIQKCQEALLNRVKGSPELGGPSPRLTSLLLVEGLTDLQLKEHDFTQVETTRGGWHPARTIALERLFLPLSRVSIPPRISITIGVAGVGKTTLVRNFVHLWARGQVGKDFSLLLPLTFRDLNTYEKLSADRLIRSVFPHIGESGLAAAALPKILLILDGLDECKTPLDFSNTVACTDPKKEIQVDHLITNIIRGNLFPEVSVWVTSRPGVAGQIPGGLVDRMTEIRGFNEEEIKVCLEEMFPEDHTLSDWVLRQVQADRALYLMCTVPAFCRLAGSALGHLSRTKPGPQDSALWTPRTLCELYSWYFRMALGGDGQEKGKASPRIEQVAHSSRKMVGTLGRLAFHGLVRRKYVFYEQDLKAFGVDLALLQSALCGCFLRREETLVSSTAYCFTHLSLQEFVAAAYYYSASKRAIFDLFTEGGVSWPRLGFLTHFRSAAQRAMQAEDGRLDVFLRFLSGLLSPRVNALLAGSLLAQGEHQGYRAQVAELLQGCLRPDVAVCARAVNTLHCLHELQHTELARSVEEAMRSGGLAGLTSPQHRAALAYLLQVSDACAQEANLSLCLSKGVLQSLLPQLLYCRSLRWAPGSGCARCVGGGEGGALKVPPPPPPARAPVSASWGCRKEGPQRGRLKASETYSLTAQEAGVQNQGVSRAELPLKPIGEHPSCLSSGCCLLASSACPHITPVFVVTRTPPPRLSSRSAPSDGHTRHVGLQAQPAQNDLILTNHNRNDPISKYGHILEALGGVRTPTYLFEEHKSTFNTL